MIRTLLASLALTAGLVAGGPALAESYSQGTHYHPVTPAQPTSAKGGKVEVVELFWYGCPHCYRLEPFVDRWLKKKPANVEFVRMPGIFRPEWEIHARAFYTAEALDVLDKVHHAMFETIHEQRRPLNNESAMMDFFAQHGVSNDDFRRVFRSFAVETKVRRAREMSQRYGAQGVPTLIVNGKFRTSVADAGGNPNVFNVVDFLIRQEGKGG